MVATGRMTGMGRTAELLSLNRSAGDLERTLQRIMTILVTAGARRPEP